MDEEDFAEITRETLEGHKRVLQAQQAFLSRLDKYYELNNRAFEYFDKAYDETIRALAIVCFGIAGAWLPLLRTGGRIVAQKTDFCGMALLCLGGAIAIGILVYKSTKNVVTVTKGTFELKQIENEVMDLKEMKNPIITKDDMKNWGKAILPFQNKLKEKTRKAYDKWLIEYVIPSIASVLFLCAGIFVLAQRFIVY